MEFPTAHHIIDIFLRSKILESVIFLHNFMPI